MIGGEIGVAPTLCLRFETIEHALKLLMRDAHHDLAKQRREPSIRIERETEIARLFGQTRTVSSFKPRLRTVSIMPGIENAAPERTDTSSGFFGSPKRLPTFSSILSDLPSPVPTCLRESFCRCQRTRCRLRW